MDPTTGGLAQPQDNQFARVDILTPSRDAFDLSRVAKNVYLGTGSGTPDGWIHYSFDITAFVIPGYSYRLRFADVENLAPIQIGVDNVSIQVSSVPEPSGILAICTGLAFTLRRRRE